MIGHFDFWRPKRLDISIPGAQTDWACRFLAPRMIGQIAFLAPEMIDISFFGAPKNRLAKFLIRKISFSHFFEVFEELRANGPQNPLACQILPQIHLFSGLCDQKFLTRALCAATKRDLCLATQRTFCVAAQRGLCLATQRPFRLVAQRILCVSQKGAVLDHP